MTEPTDQDRRNFAVRKIIADRQNREYTEALGFAIGLFGVGWAPHGRHSLVTHAEADRARNEGGRAQSTMDVITCRSRSGQERHFVVESGSAREVAGWMEAFGAMLTEPDPDRTIDVRGERVQPHKYQLHWSGFEPGYEPRTAEQLAEARGKRKQRAASKARAELEKRARESLFPEWILEQGGEGR